MKILLPGFTPRPKARLSSREKAILWEQMAGKTLSEIAEAFKITRERVRQIVQRAVAELKRVAELERRESGALGVHSAFLDRAWGA